MHTFQKLSSVLTKIKTATAAQPRHKWTAEQILTLLNKYREWSQKHTIDQPFKLKDFITSLREHFSFFDQLDEKQFYNRVSRTLYRSLVKHGLAWKHAGKTRLSKKQTQPEVGEILDQLEKLGVGIATDGSVLLILTAKFFTGVSDEGYFLPTIPHAITHLKAAVRKNTLLEEVLGEDISEIIRLLNKLIEVNKQLGQSVFMPNIKRKLDSNEYDIQQDPNEPHLFTVTKKADGTKYYCNTQEHTCTCPAGQEKRTCKHLINVLFQ